MSNEQPIMYIFVNTSLNLSHGGIAVQCCHLAVKIIDNIYQEIHLSLTPTKTYINYMIWKKEPIKVILKATTEQLEKLKDIEGYTYITDCVRNSKEEFLTVGGFPPSSTLSTLAKEYKLYG